MKKLAILVTTILLLAGTGLAQRKSHQSIELVTPDASRAVYLKATASKNIFDPNEPRSLVTPRYKIETFSVEMWADRAGLGMEGVEPLTFEVVVDLASGRQDVPFGEITIENDVGFLTHIVRVVPLVNPLAGAQTPNPIAPYSIKTVKLMWNGEVMAEGSF